MLYLRSAFAAFLMAFVGSGVALAGSVQSGPQPGDKVPGPFKPFVVTGPEAGQASCQYCKNGSHPVAVIFTKEITPEVAALIQKIDAATAANKEHGMGSYVVTCSDAAGTDRQLQALAQKLGIQNTVLTLYKAAGPERYRLAPQAEVTVLLYNHLTVKANHAFQKGELNAAAMDTILADVNKMIAE